MDTYILVNMLASAYYPEGCEIDGMESTDGHTVSIFSYHRLLLV